VVTKGSDGGAQEVVLLTSTPFRRRVDFFNQALPGFILFFEGIGNLSGDQSIRVASPILNIVVGVGIFIAVAVEERRARIGMRSRVSWIDIVGGLIVVITGLNKLHPGKTFQPGTLYMITGVLISVKGVFARKMPRWRVVFTGEGFYARTSLFNRLKLDWSNVTGIRAGESEISFLMNGGESKVLSLRRCGNRADLIGRFEAHARSRNLTVEKE
jgi:hypothetical protein